MKNAVYPNPDRPEDTLWDGPIPAHCTEHWMPTMNLQFNRGILEQQWKNDTASKKEWRPVQSVDIMSHDRDFHQP